MNNPSTPGSGDKLDLASVNGALLYFTVKERKVGIETSFGVADAIICDVAVLDGPQKAAVFADTFIFPKVLAGQLAAFVGKDDPVVVGRLGQGLAKPGKSAPWVLIAATPAEVATAEKYEAHIATLVAVDTESPF
jgi:hypothetical protein